MAQAASAVGGTPGEQATARGSRNVTHGDLQVGDLHAALQPILSQYFNQTQLEAYIEDYTQRCSSVAQSFSIGRSTEGAELLVLELGVEPGAPGPRPHFKYLGNMHGDEPVGRQLTLALAEWLCHSFQTDPRAARLLEGARLQLLPSMNPDGFAKRTRENSKGVDLNRDFPDVLATPDGPLVASGAEQAETAAVMRWSSGTPFVGSASMHEGAVVANYPWDGNAGMLTQYEASPDDATFRHLASTYAQAHKGMAASAEFVGGITNGAAWYAVRGGMQDWNYVQARCMEVTLELSQNKWPPPETLGAVFEANIDALLALPLATMFGGVSGLARAASQGQAQGGPLAAKISVQGIQHDITAGATFGDFYRPLAAGDWLITASMAGYGPASVPVSVPKDGSGVVLDFQLSAVDQTGRPVNGQQSTGRVLATSAKQGALFKQPPGTLLLVIFAAVAACCAVAAVFSRRKYVVVRA